MSRTLRYFALPFLLAFAFGVLLYSFQPQRASNRWIAVGKMQSARAGACSVQLSDGRVLITGGEDSSGVLNTAEVFDSSGAFNAVTPMSSAHADHVCAALEDGRVLVAGGRLSGATASNVAEVYDPVTKKWSFVGSMMAARSGATASRLKGGSVLIAGGENNGSALASIETFDPLHNVFGLLNA
ncbi:MAG: hypothetical protein DMG59_04015, partial [Acidobacteria bacterium]